MSRPLVPFLVLVACLLSTARDAAAQTLSGLSLAEAAAPDDLIIEGEGFLGGAASPKGLKPKVRLVSEESGKSYKPKVKGLGDTQIPIRLRKTPAGTYTVRVTFKGGLQLDVPEPLVVRAPELLGVTNEVGFGCARTTVTGRFLGLLPGRVFVGGKKAKVIGWQPIFEFDGEPVTQAHTVTYVTPPKLGPGPHDVELRSFAGSGTLPEALALVPTDLPCRAKKGPAQMVARLDGQGLPKKLRSKPQLLVGWTRDLLETESAPDATGGALPAWAQDDIAARVAAHAAASGAEGGTSITLLGTARKGKAVRVLACVFPEWSPADGDVLAGGDAADLDAVLVLLDLRLQKGELFLLAGWEGPAGDVDLAVHEKIASPDPGYLHARFGPAVLELVEGDGAATIELQEALVLNAREVFL